MLIVDTDAHNSLVETNALPGTVAAYGYTIVLQGWITMRYNGREVSGRTVVDYINQMLLIEASYMLKQTSFPIVQIVDHLHFSEPASFTRFFTRMKGMNPREFRKGIHDF